MTRWPWVYRRVSKKKLERSGAQRPPSLDVYYNNDKEILLQLLKICMSNKDSHRYLRFCYPILAGFFGFLATIIGSHFFTFQNTYAYIFAGLLLFLLCNHLLYKLKFNSYFENGSTTTTILIFVSQIVSMAIYKKEQVGCKWISGVFLILIGTLLIQSQQKFKQRQMKQQND